jgi:hypothetical protein
MRMTDLDACRDGLALVAAANRGDAASVNAMLETYREDSDLARGQLLGSLVAHAVAILRLASQTMGVDPDKILGSVAATLNDPGRA